MDSSAKRELNNIKSELQSIINELTAISDGVVADFDNIGEERCAACINAAKENCRKAKKRLNNLDTETVTAEYAAAHQNA